MWLINQQRVDKIIKDKNLNDLIDALGEDHGVGVSTLKRYRLGVTANYDETFKHVTDEYDDYVNVANAVQTGEQLNKRDKKAGGEGKVYDNDRSYAREGDKWEEYTPLSDRRIAGETGLRKEYNQITDDYRTASRGHDGVMEGLDSDNGFGDIMAITSFRIMFEPDSVVREAEFDITSKAGGLINTWLNTPEQLMNGDRLKPEVREQMKGLVIRYMKKREDYVDRHYNDYRKMATDNKFNPDVIQHPFKSYKWSKYYDKNVKVGAGSSEADKQKNLDQLGVAGG